MAELLPDIDVTDVGYIVWWNALDHDASYLDPVELTSYTGIADHTPYNNGIDGTLDRDSRLRWRAKTDGWMLVWYDTTQGTVDDLDFVANYTDGNVDIIENVPAQELNALREEADNAGEMDFSYDDVSFGDYRDRTPDIKRFESRKYTPPGPARWAYRRNEMPEKVHLTGRSRMNVNGESVSAMKWGDRTLVPEQSGEGESTGQVEAVGEGWLRGSQTFHRMTGGVPTYEDSDVRGGLVSIHV
jgi:hypothetical protein